VPYNVIHVLETYVNMAVIINELFGDVCAPARDSLQFDVTLPVAVGGVGVRCGRRSVRYTRC